MSSLFYPRLAAGNIKKNRKIYVPYILTCIFSTAMFYIISSLSKNEGIMEMYGGSNVMSMLRTGVAVTGITVFIFLFYTNSFLMKQRKKEFGLFNILGMEKKHLAKVMAFETFYIFGISIIVGLIAGMLLDKLMYLIILKILDAEITLGFYISKASMINTLALFGVIFLLIFLNSVRQVHLSNPIELLRSRNEGEKEPKTKIFMTVFGVLCLGGGYYISVTTKDPVAAFTLIFVAVILVIIGTYCLFAAGSIALLKILRKNKNYYYQTNHFTSVAGMIYRMKQNAAGLANICVLSTMVLVMVSSTTSLIMGQRDILKTRFPNDIGISAEFQTIEEKEQILKDTKEVLKQREVDIKERLYYTLLSFTTVREEDQFLTEKENAVREMGNISQMFIVTLEDYNRINEKEEVLNKGEIFIRTNRTEYEYQQLSLLGESYQVKKVIDDFAGIGEQYVNTFNCYFIVVSDMEELINIEQKEIEAYQEMPSNIELKYGIDLKESTKEQVETGNAIREKLSNIPTAYVEIKEENVQDFKGLYGSFFFIGIFLSALFIVITILIIYYKQISEGYDDRERFLIMQKVGMSQWEVRKSIRSQILTVFYLPLITAGVHVAFSVPFFLKILLLLNLDNKPLFVACTVVSFLVFALIYSLIYTLTARVYYQIVTK